MPESETLQRASIQLCLTEVRFAFLAGRRARLNYAEQLAYIEKSIVVLLQSIIVFIEAEVIKALSVVIVRTRCASFW